MEQRSLERVWGSLARSPWTEERIAYVKMRWSSGASARRISSELANGISRNAVLGLLHRLEMARLSPFAGRRGRRSDRTTGSRPARLRRPPAETPIRAPATPPAWVANARPYVDDPGSDAEIPLSQRLTLMQLDSRTCRWPVGDPCHPGFFFCGAKSVGGRPYCTAHEMRSRHTDKTHNAKLRIGGMRPTSAGPKLARWTPAGS
jgi:GcrA cell cycle regulator